MKQILENMTKENNLKYYGTLYMFLALVPVAGLISACSKPSYKEKWEKACVQRNRSRFAEWENAVVAAGPGQVEKVKNKKSDSMFSKDEAALLEPLEENCDWDTASKRKYLADGVLVKYKDNCVEPKSQNDAGAGKIYVDVPCEKMAKLR